MPVDTNAIVAEQHLGRRRVGRRGLRENPLRRQHRFDAPERQCRRARTCTPKPRAPASARSTAAHSQPVHITNDYTEMLPSINFTFNLSRRHAAACRPGPRDLPPAARRAARIASAVEQHAAAHRQRRQSIAGPVHRQSGRSLVTSIIRQGIAGGAGCVLQGSGKPHRLHHRAGDHRRHHLRGDRSVQRRRRWHHRCGVHLPDAVLRPRVRSAISAST